MGNLKITDVPQASAVAATDDFYIRTGETFRRVPVSKLMELFVTGGLSGWGFGYATCSTAEATAAKTAVLTGYQLIKGGFVAVRFTNAVGGGATLSINSQTAKAIYYNGSAIFNNVIRAGDIAVLCYDGTYYQLVSIMPAGATILELEKSGSTVSLNMTFASAYTVLSNPWNTYLLLTVDTYVVLLMRPAKADAVNNQISIEATVGTTLYTATLSPVPGQAVLSGTLVETQIGAGGDGGQPIPVAYASNMTDINSLYLYLGNEQGYEYGYVYAYMSGAWTKTTIYGKGQDGTDGFSPIVTVDQVENGVAISVTDENGTTTAEVENGTATDAQVTAAVADWLDDHPEATTTVEDGSITDAKLAQTNGVFSRVNAIKDEAAMCKLTASDFQRGYWSGSSIASSTTRICNKTLIPVLAGDILTLDEQSIYLGAWLYINGDTSVDATELLGYTDSKPQYYTFTQSGLLVIQGRKHNSSSTLTASDFIGSVTIQHKIVRDVVNDTTVVDIVEEKGFTRRTLGQSQFTKGYWNEGVIVTSNTRICCKEELEFNKGDSLIYQSNVAELGIWARVDSDPTNVNIVPYAPNINRTKITFQEHTMVRLQLKATYGNINVSNMDAIVTIERYGNAYDGLAELYLGKMIQANGAADGITSSTTRVVMKSVLALPYGDRTKLTVKVNHGFKVGVRVGSSPYNLGDNLYWFYDGDTISLPAGSNFYRFGIAKLGDDTITVDDLASADFRVFYEPHETGFEPFDGAANACMLDVPTGSSDMNYRTLPTFLHGSDMHGDYERVKRFAAFAEKLGVSMAAITGDLVPFNVFSDCNHFEWLHDIIKKSPVLWGLCVGNHDSHIGSGNGATTMADDDVYSIFYEPIKTEIGNATEKVWYVKDMTSQKIRVISLDLYQYGGVWTKTFFTQEQLTWLCTTLASTPQNYGVVILMHAQQLSVVKDENHAKFFQTVRKGESAEYYNAVDNDGDPIGDIVDAFIKKTTISKTYTQNSGADTLTVSGNFTSVATGVEFICYMTGHFHQDTIGYAPRPVGDPKQLVLNITCGVSAYGGSSYKYLADCSDIPRNQMDATQDAFNIYGIDRATKTVRVARIGSNMNQLMELRDFMLIPYAD